MKGVIYLEKFPITPDNSVCKCVNRCIVARAEGGEFFHVGCGKFIPQEEE